jgi:predicted porin
MKKSLIALAALSTIAGSAFAQSSVSIYGVLDASEYRSQSNGHAYTAFNTKTTATSRIGLKGTEDLGSGLKASFNLEEEVSLATGGTGSTSTGAGAGSFNRATNVGLESSQFGGLTLGRQAAPIYAAAAGKDALGINSLGLLNYYVATHAVGAANSVTGSAANANIGGQATSGTSAGIYNAGVGYATPVIYGFQAKVFTTPGSGTTSINSGEQQQALLSYVGYGFDLTAATGKQKNISATTPSVVIPTTAQTEQLYVGKYTYGPVVATLGLSQLRYANPAVNHNSDITTAGLKYAYSNNTTLGISWTEAKDKTVGANKSTTTGLYASYALSPRTNVYGLAGFTQNKGAATTTAIYGGSATDAAHTADSYAVGIKHTF